jgi:hypothetical protein
MRDPIQTLLSALERDEGGIALVWCPDLGLRDWLVAEVESLAPEGSEPFRTASVEEAIDAPNRLALVVPDDERTTVLDLDGSRDRLRSEERPRTQPVVLFLLRDGDGRQALATEAISLSSWVGGSDADPEALAEIDVMAERERFHGENGKTPEQWLQDWRTQGSPKTSELFGVAYRAMLLERPL